LSPRTFSTASTQLGYGFGCRSAAIESSAFQIFLNYLSTQSCCGKKAIWGRSA
jgi:hypothetical protein